MFVLCEEKRYESYDISHAKSDHFLRKLWGEERLTEGHRARRGGAPAATAPHRRSRAAGSPTCFSANRSYYNSNEIGIGGEGSGEEIRKIPNFASGLGA